MNDLRAKLRIRTAELLKERQNATTQAQELAEKLDASRQAVNGIGLIPTLSELRTLLTALRDLI